MATIPIGAGRRVAPGQVPLVPQANLGAPGRALAQAGAIGVQYGVQRMDEENRRVLAETEAAERVAAAAALAGGKLALRERAAALADRIEAGELDERNAGIEWQSATPDVLNESTKTLPKDLGQRVGDALRLHAAEVPLEILRPALRRRRQGETRANVAAGLEAYEREAVDDRPRAVARAATLLESAQVAAGWGPDDAFQMLQTFRERTAENVAQHLMRTAGSDVPALDDLLRRVESDEFADLSPQARERVANSVNGRKAQLLHAQEVAARRIEAQAERRLREAESSTHALQVLIDGGATPDDAFLQEVSRKTAGTLHADAVRSLLQQAAARAGFAGLPPERQRETILALRAQATAQGSNPELEKRIAQLETLATASATKAEKEPLQWAADTRLLPAVEPVQFGDVETMAVALRTRVDQAAQVSAALRRSVSPLLSTEALRAKEMLSALPWSVQSTAVRTLANALPPGQQRALAEQMGDSAVGLAMLAASVSTGTGADVPGLVLRGADAERAGRLPKDDGVLKTDTRRIAQELARVEWPTPRVRDAAVQTATLVYQGMRDERGGSASWKKAIEHATGGLADWGGAKVPVPPGWNESRFSNALRNTDAAQLQGQMRGPVFVGGSEVKAEELAKALTSATLIPLGPGQYAIDVGGLVVTKDRRPFTFTLRD